MRRARRSGGFTLVEMLLALTITALIGSSVLGMLFAISKGTADSTAERDLKLEQAVVRARIHSVLRRSTTVLDSSATHMVLWKGDSRQNDSVNMSELIRIEYVAADSTIYCYEPAGAILDLDDTTYPDGTDYDAVTAALIAAGTFRTTTVADSVTATKLSVMAVGAAVAVEYELSLRGCATPVVGTVSLRGSH